MRTAAAERRPSRALTRRSRRIADALRLRAAKSFACDAGEDSSALRWRGRSPTQTVPPVLVGEADEGRELVPPASAHPLTNFARAALAFDECLEPIERVVPLGRDEIEATAHLIEAARLELPDVFAPVASTSHQTGIGQDVKMLRDCLPRDVEARGELRDGKRALIAKATHQAKACLVAQSGEDRRRGRQQSGGAVTPHGRGISR